MKAIVLCAGLGTRLGELTKEVPKPMLPINGKPLLEYIIKHLAHYGFTDIGLNTHFKPDQIVDYFGDGSSLGVKLTYCHELELLGTAGALPQFREWLNGEDFLVVYGDVLTDQDLSALVTRFKKQKTFTAMLLHKRAQSNSIAKLDDSNRLTAFIERPSESEREAFYEKSNELPSLVNSGVQMLSNSILEYIDENSSFDLPKNVYSKTYLDRPIYGEVLTGFRVAIDSPVRYQMAVDGILSGCCKSFA